MFGDLYLVTSTQSPGGSTMLGFIYRLIREFELEHDIRPNLLYLNQFHAAHLKASFDPGYSMEQIMNILEMELVIDNDIMHPRVSWMQTTQKVAAI